MKPARPRLSSLFVVAVMLAAAFVAVVPPAASGEGDRYELGRVKVTTGTVSEYPGAAERLDEAGDFIALRFGNDTWFGVVYGTEESPNFIHLRSFQKSYLGGATVLDGQGKTLKQAQPLPVIRHTGQALTSLLEFKDSGYKLGPGKNKNKTIGEDNGLFDYRPRPGFSGHEGLQVGKHEPVFKAVSLKTAWTLHDMSKSYDPQARTARISFSLSAYNLTYLLNDTTERLDEVTLTFRLTARAVDVDAQVPWYEITVESSSVTASQQVKAKQFNTTSVKTDLKYDQLIRGWDYSDRDNSSKLMLLTRTSFATFTPKGVAKWMRAQFLTDRLDDATGVVEYDTDYEVDQMTGENRSYQVAESRGGEADDGDGKPNAKGRVAFRALKKMDNKIQRLRHNQISFKDNWERTARFTWVSNVNSTIDGNTTEQTLSYQIHNLQGLGSFLADNNPARLEQIQSRGLVKGQVVLGGYVYPAGDTLFHDPGFEASTLLVELTGGLGNLLNILAGLQILQMMLVAVIAVAAIHLTHRRLQR